MPSYITLKSVFFLLYVVRITCWSEDFYSFCPVRIVGAETLFGFFHIKPNTQNFDLRLKCVFRILTIECIQSFFSFVFFNFLFFSYLAKSSWKLCILTLKISSELLETSRANTFYSLLKRRVSQGFFARTFHYQHNSFSSRCCVCV